MARRERVGEEQLKRWRSTLASDALAAISAHCKRDVTFEPTKDPRTQRWHARVGQGEFELLLTGSKFFDPRTQQGGGGAVDLAMYVLAADFRTAAEALLEAGL